MPQRSRPPSGLLNIRTALILLLAGLTGSIVMVLTWLSRRNAAEAALAGLTALGAGIKFFDWLIT